jgi:hypothetical protein
VPVVAGDAALDHFVTPPIARHDERGEIAAAEAKRAERNHNDDLQQQLTRSLAAGDDLSEQLKGGAIKFLKLHLLDRSEIVRAGVDRDTGQ